MEMDSQKQTLTVAEAAMELSLTPHALWQQLYRGRFPHRRWGKKVVILRDEMEAFLHSLPGKTVKEAIENLSMGQTAGTTEAAPPLPPREGDQGSAGPGGDS